MRGRLGAVGIAISAVGALCGACATGAAVASARTPSTALVSALDEGRVAFGSMVSDRTEAGGAALAADARVDFAFYDMERSYDLAALQAFMRGFRAGGTGKTLLVRIAPIANGREAAQQRVTEILAAGADGIVFPHVRNREDAELAVSLVTAGARAVWPLDPDGGVLAWLMIEDREAVENMRAILSTPGVGVGGAGQGSLRSALGNDDQATEAAIQSILGTCKQLRVACAKLVSDGDAERRVREGFRVIMGPASALEIGRRAQTAR